MIRVLKVLPDGPRVAVGSVVLNHLSQPPYNSTALSGKFGQIFSSEANMVLHIDLAVLGIDENFVTD